MAKRQIEIPVHNNSIVTSRSLNTNHPNNSGLVFSEIIDNLDELELKLKELKIRFDTNPHFYQRQDYLEFLNLIAASLIHLYKYNPDNVITSEWLDLHSNSYVPSEKLTKETIDTKLDIILDLEDIRQGAALGYTALQSFTEVDPTVPSWAKEANKPEYTAEEVGALPDNTFIPENVSDLNNDAGYITSKDIPVIDKTSDSSSSFVIDPNKMYMFGARTNLTITLNAGEEGIVNEYMFQFTSDSVVTTLIVPDTITWLKEPNILTNKKYLVSIENNLGIIGEWNNE